MIPFIGNYRKGKIIVVESKSVVAKDWDWRRRLIS
jgi:hypothetical protein